MFGKLEQLETRRMMAGDFMQVADYQLYDIGPIVLFYPVTVNGTNGSDNLNINHNGVVSSHPEWRVSKVIVNALGGNDYVNASNSNTPLEAHGGYGLDTIHGSTVADFITGGGDTDSVYGNAGDDNIDGGV